MDILRLADAQEATLEESSIHAQLVFTTTTMLLNELLAETAPNSSLIDNHLSLLLDHVYPKDVPLMATIFDALLLLSQNYALMRLGEDRTLLVTQRMVLGIRTVMTTIDVALGDKDELCGRLIHSLMEWLLVLPPDWLAQHHSIREQIFAALEDALQRQASISRTASTVSRKGASGGSGGGGEEQQEPVVFVEKSFTAVRPAVCACMRCRRRPSSFWCK